MPLLQKLLRTVSVVPFAPSSPRPTAARRLALPFVVVLSAAAACDRPAPGDRAAWAATGLAEGPRMPAMVLPGADGEPFDLRAETEGKVTFLFLGYTWCPDVCPVHMANLGRVIDDLQLQTSDELAVVFVSVDPDRDTPERITGWLDAIHRNFEGVRPTREQTAALETALGLPHSGFTREPGQDDYLVGHAAQVLGFDRDGVLRAVWPWGIRQRDWKIDLPRVMRGEWPAPSIAADAAFTLSAGAPANPDPTAGGTD